MCVSEIQQKQLLKSVPWKYFPKKTSKVLKKYLERNPSKVFFP